MYDWGFRTVDGYLSTAPMSDGYISTVPMTVRGTSPTTASIVTAREVSPNSMYDQQPAVSSTALRQSLSPPPAEDALTQLMRCVEVY